jgi:hypothetical protein
MTLPDEITIITDQGTRTISVEEFLALPLSERINHVLSGTARFFAKGEELDGKQALAAVRAAKAEADLGEGDA